MSNPQHVVLSFVDCINAHDTDSLTALMTEDHGFVDATGAVHTGLETMRRGWREYFQACSDYQIHIDELVAEGDVVALFGWAGGSANGRRPWHIPAAWKARVRGGRVAEWRVYADVEPMLQSMGIRRSQETDPASGPARGGR